MFNKNKNQSLIEVSFFECEAQTPFAVSEMPSDQLPDTFEINTMLHIGEDDWQIIESAPSSKKEFIETGKLSLFLKRVEITSVDPNKILYSLPTINDELPLVEEVSTVQASIVFPEDDWRQREFISSSYQDLILQEWQSVEGVYEHHSVGEGFSEIHIRRKIVSPFTDNRFTVRDLQSRFSIEQDFSDIAFDSAPALIVGNFGLLTTSGWFLWGCVDDEESVLALNLHPSKPRKGAEFSKEIDSFLAEKNLFLIDWPRLFWGRSHDHSIEKYISQFYV